jgi:SAM-dependent methyltransferase
MDSISVDVDDVLDDVAKALLERETGRSQSYRSEVHESEDIIYLLPGAWENITQSLVSLDQSLAPSVGVPPGEERTTGLTGAFKRYVKRMVEKAVYWYVNPVVSQLHGVHSAVTRALHEIADQLRSTNDRLDVIERENVLGRVRSLEGERFDERIGRLERSWRQHGGEASPAAPDAETIEPAEGGSAPAGEVELRGVGKDRTVSTERFRQLSRFHFDYYWFESIHRGDRELIKGRHKPYLEYFTGCENVLDLGCGRGEFLELMKEKGIGGYGIDIETDAVQYCTDAGLDAVQGEALEHMAGLPDDSLDGVFMSQVAEHLTPSELIETVGLAYAKMKAGGHIVAETPNPQCLLIFASFFYADLSHVQPIHPETMRFLFLSAGFRDVQVKFTNPVPRNQRLARVVPPPRSDGEEWIKELNANMDKLNTVLFGYMDYAAIARK